MESESLSELEKSFRQINIDDEQQSAKRNEYDSDPFEYHYKPKPILRHIPKEYVDFEQYVKENCANKIQILNRETFQDIKRPIVIFFNHFRVKCAYHTEWLDRLYELALKYGDRIEFIAADMIDMDVMYPGRNPLNFFCKLVRSESESPNTYAIDEKKRIHEHFDAYKTLENLSELCEYLLSGNLFPSQDLPENNETSLVKICVHRNYEDVILKSTKNVFLIVNIDRYQHYDYEPNYEKVALALKDYNLDIVYMEAEKNYVPFEYNVNCYPTILFIPCGDKNNFIYYYGPREEKLIIEFLQDVMEHPDILLMKQQDLRVQKIVKVPDDFELNFDKLAQFLEQNFDNKFKVLNRKILEKLKRYCIIIFMDFSSGKCMAHHIQWLNKIHEFAESSYSYEYFVADFRDIDIVNTKWKTNDIKNSANGKPKIYVTDYLKHIYEFGNFNSPSALFYFTESVQSRQLYYSQLYPRRNLTENVKEWTADYFNIFLKKCKKHIFIIFYSSDDEKAESILDLLNQIAADVNHLNIEIAKFDIKFNYVDLQYACDNYPAYYFIPKNNKRSNSLYTDSDLSKDKILEFIKSNMDTN